MNQSPGPAHGGMPQQQQVSGKTSGLAITAFVLACLFFLPLIPLIGTVLGIISLARMRPEQGGRGLAIAAIPVGLVVVLFFQGMIAAVSIPAFIKYTRRAKTIEATESLDKLRHGARAFVQAERYDSNGQLLPQGFPVARTGWVPATPCCEQPTRPRCVDPADTWSAEPWRSLYFQLQDPHYFQYRYSSDGRTAEIEARADLDCDGTYSSYKLVGEVDARNEVTFRGPIIVNELE